MVNTIIVCSIVAIALFCIWYFNKNTVFIKIRKGEIASFKSTMELIGLPIITFYSGEKKYHFLIDTGSNYSYLERSVDITKKVVEGSEDVFYGSAGVEQKSISAEIELHYNKAKYPCVVKVADLKEAFSKVKEEIGITISGILGTDFLNKFKYCIDFKEQVIYARK